MSTRANAEAGTGEGPGSNLEKDGDGELDALMDGKQLAKLRDGGQSLVGPDQHRDLRASTIPP